METVQTQRGYANKMTEISDASSTSSNDEEQAENTQGDDAAAAVEDTTDGPKPEDTEPLKEEARSSSGESGSDDDGEKDVKQYYCGFGRWRPRCLQVFANPKFFTFIFCMNALIEGAIVSGFGSVVISTIEKRYQFSSIAASFIVSVFDLAVVLSVLLISYFGHKAHKPRWLGIGLLLQGVGTLIYTSPQFLFGKYRLGSDVQLQLEECLDDSPYSENCDSANNIAYTLFVVGNFVVGISAAPLFTVGVSYIDDIVRPKFVSIHLGLFYICAVVGPAIGYGLGGAFLSVYVDPLETTTLTESDPGWVGAWWVCFLVSSIASFLLAIPFLMFPRLLPNSHLVKEERKKEMAQKYTSKYEEEESFRSQVKSFPRHMKKLLKNASWVFLTIAVTFLFFSLDGMVAFGPKYIESQYNVPASTASILIGAIAIPAGGLGVLVGSLIVYFVKSKGKMVSSVNWIVSILAVIPALGFALACPTLGIPGISTDYALSPPDTGLGDVTISQCNFDCNCTSSVFEPVCGADGLTYFSPCRAGCQKYLDEDNVAVIENCSCIADSLLQQYNTSYIMANELMSAPDEFLNNATAETSKCDIGCNRLGVFLIAIAGMIFLIFILKIPTVIVTLRCIADEQRTLALGAQSVIFRAFGSIPGPIAFGSVFDTTCIYWQYECNRRGNCWVYDNRNLSLRALSIAVVGILMNLVFAFLSWVFYPPALCTKTKEAEDAEKKDERSTSIYKPTEEDGSVIPAEHKSIPEKALEVKPANDLGGRRHDEALEKTIKLGDTRPTSGFYNEGLSQEPDMGMIFRTLTM